MTAPALFYAAVLVFFLGFELFGLPLVLGDPEGHLVLSTYLYKLTNKLGTPSYHLMAAVAVCIIAVTFPLVLLQRWLLKTAGKYVSVKGKATRQKLLPLGGWKWLALAIVALWLVFTIVVPISGIALRAFVEQWGEGIKLADVLTLANFRQVFDQSDQVRAIVNTFLIGTIGGALAVACYMAIGLAGHRQRGGVAKVLDYLVLLPRAVPGLLAGLAFLWIFLFVPGLKELRNTIFSVWLAYTVVWLAYGLRLISGALLQIGPELEESARTVGAIERAGAASRHHSADPFRPAGELAPGVHDLRARILDRRVPARSGHRGHRLDAGFAVERRGHRSGCRAVADQHCAGCRRLAASRCASGAPP